MLVDLCKILLFAVFVFLYAIMTWVIVEYVGVVARFFLPI